MSRKPAPDEGSLTTADATLLAAAKRGLRAAVLRRRGMRSEERRTADDEARFGAIVTALAGQAPRTVAAYVSTSEEPDSRRLIAWSRVQGVRVLLPVVTDGRGRRLDQPAWAAYEGPDALRAGPLGLLEPVGTRLPATALTEADLVVCPGLAGNRRGQRLGRGGGWYDRALAHADPDAPVWLLLNADEVLEVIPTHPWDRRVDALVTPAGVIACDP